MPGYEEGSRPSCGRFPGRGRNGHAENNSPDILGGIAGAARTAFLAGVGAVAYGAEKAGTLVDDLVKKGELTVDQGKDLNSELTVKAQQAVSDAQDTILKARLAGMTPEERAAFVDRARELASDMDAKDKEKAEADDEPIVEDPDDASAQE